jgi:hypothetical protein
MNENRRMLRVTLTKDNGLARHFVGPAGEMFRDVPVFPDSWGKDEPQERPKIFLSVASHNSATNPTGFVKTEIEFDDIYKTVTSGCAYSPFNFRNGYRKSENNMGGATLLCLDIDQGMTVSEAVEMMHQYSACIVTTRSHRKEKNGMSCDRFRVFFELATPLEIPLEDYESFMQEIFRMFGSVADAATKDLARFYFSSPHDAQMVKIEGQPLEWEPIYQRVKQQQVRDKLAKAVSVESRRGKTLSASINSLPGNTIFQTRLGNRSFLDLKAELQVGEKIACRCKDAIDHGGLGSQHYAAFIKKADNGNVMYACSGGRCAHVGTLWCEDDKRI